MARAPYIRFFVGDYIASTSHLTTEQHGAYMLIIFAMWNSGGYLPNDPAKLARIARLSVRRWQSISDDIFAFFEVESSHITQERLRSELQNVLENVAKKSAAGKIGNAVKSLKIKERASADAGASATANEPAEALQPVRNSYSYPQSETYSESETHPDPKPQSEVSSDFSLSIEANLETANEKYTEKSFDEFWKQCPRKVGKGIARSHYRKIINNRTANPSDLLSGIMRYSLERRGEDPRFTQHPATWLKGEGWLNEPAPPHSSTTVASAISMGIRHRGGGLLDE